MAQQLRTGVRKAADAIGGLAAHRYRSVSSRTSGVGVVEKYRRVLAPGSGYGGRRCFSTAPASSSDSPDDFMQGANSVYVEEMYAAWKADPQSVHKSWDVYFRYSDAGRDGSSSFAKPPRVIEVPSAMASLESEVSDVDGHSDSLGLAYLIRAYQVRGHEVANIDPLGLNAWRSSSPPPELDPSFHGFTPKDMDRTLRLIGRSSGGMVGYLEELARQPKVTLRQVISRLQKTYCETLGVEYMHMSSREKCNWIRQKVENPAWLKYSKEKKLHIFERLSFADTFEKFIQKKYNTVKRFGLNGGESVIPGLKAMVDIGSELGIENYVLGMAHRGRMNVLANVLRKPMPRIFKEFQDSHYDVENPDDYSFSKDVKYHLGTSMDRTYPDGRRVHLSLVANPSHLEAVNPVVNGKTRAKQFYHGGTAESMKRSMSVLIHGDAAFAGQGVVYECMQMSRVSDFAVGGTIHVILNNQVGFTTDPTNARSTQYCSDLGKTFEIPIFHCNGDDPMAVCTAFELAVEWRQQFGEDCIIDMICYRRMGHNEIDQPLFTQPLLYKQIQQHEDTASIFEQRLVREGVATQEELDEIKSFVLNSYETDFEKSSTWDSSDEDEWLSSKWSGYKSPKQLSRIRKTGVDVEVLRSIGIKMSTPPAGFSLHKQLTKILETQKQSIEAGKGINWGTAEALAFGTLLLEGNHVRLTGQDVERGTFSHRHAVVHDQESGKRYTPLNHLAKSCIPSLPESTTLSSAPEAQAKMTVRNSILSEYGVLGFETGYSLENPNSLVMWEAQFGDFANGAQVMFDQFVSAGEDKWLRQSGLTVLLPHGYDGQGAEHSSCRVERWLQMSDCDPDGIPSNMDTENSMQIQHSNWQVVNCTTPANYYHVLRRQVHREFRKPLIVVAPKKLLRLKEASSSLEEMGANTMFQMVIPEKKEEVVANASSVRRIILCTGQVYYDLNAEREKAKSSDVAIVRVEQLAPFPFGLVAAEVARYPNAEVCWVQEEPKNMGAWTFVHPCIESSTREINKDEKRPRYIGRATSAAPATGLPKVHVLELNNILKEAIHD